MVRPLGSLVALVLLTTVAPAFQARDPVLDRVIALGREDSQVLTFTDLLCNDIGPRLTGSRNLQRACVTTRDVFAQLGLDARLEQWGDTPVGFDRGPWSGRVVSPEIIELVCGTMSWTPGTFGPVRGPAVAAPTTAEELEAVKARLPGAWVLEPPRQRRGFGRGGDNGGNNAPDADLRQQIAAAYAEAGIAGVVRATSNDWIVTSGRMGVDWNDLPKDVEISLIKSQYDQVKALLDAGQDVELEFDIENHFIPGPVPLYNVIADIPGSEFPDEYVIVGGHLDSWDGADGATDNGTGCATSLEAARLLMKAGAQPRRTIRFMLWSGEEQGLLGSRAYVQAHPELMEKISAVLVHDEGTNYLDGISYTKAMAEDFAQVFAPVQGLDPNLPFELREVEGLRGGGSDHASFLAADVPGFFWSQNKGRANYTSTHHTQLDRTDMVIPEYQKHSAMVVALAAYGIANLDHLLSREGLQAPRGQGFTRGFGGGGRRMGVNLDGGDLTITAVTPGSLAEQAGWKEGDVIVKVDGDAVTEVVELIQKIQGGKAQKTLRVKRGDEELAFEFDWEKNTAKAAVAAGAGADGGK